MDAFAQVASTPLGGSSPPIDMSVYGLFMQADWIVKAVMIALLLASFWSWAIIFEKMIRLRSLKKSAQGFEDTFWSGVSLEDLYDRVGAKPDDPMSSIFSAAMREWRRSVSKGLATSATARAALRQRIEQVMGVTIQREMEAIEKRLGFLAMGQLSISFSSVVHICRLDEDNPEAAWGERKSAVLKGVAERLQRNFEAIHLEGPRTDLTVGLLRASRWIGGGDTTVDGISHMANLPTEEVFTSPDPERTQGVVRATQPVPPRRAASSTD